MSSSQALVQYDHCQTHSTANQLAAYTRPIYKIMMGSRQPPYSFVRRGRVEYGRNPAYMGYFGRGEEMFFDDLEIDTRNDRYGMRQMYPRYNDRYEQRYDDGYDAPNRGERRQSFEASRGDAVNRQRNRSNAPALKKNGLPFARAITKLHKQLTKAERIYKNFMNEFDTDVIRIRKYGKPGMVSDLWILKVAAKRIPKLVLADDERIAVESETQEMFNDVKQELIQLLEDVLRSDVRQQNPTHTNAATRLQRKVETANELIVELLEGAPQTRESCNSLINEIDLLKHLVNPEDAKNTMFRSDSQGGSHQGNNGNQGGGYQSGSDEEEHFGEQTQESQPVAAAQNSAPAW